MLSERFTMNESIYLLLKDLNHPPNYKIDYHYNRPYITITDNSVIDTWSLTNNIPNGEYAYYIQDTLYVYKLHREILSHPLLDKFKILL